MTQVSGIVFDKDGTLFDFQATWGKWAARFIESLAGGDAALARTVAEALSFDLATKTYRPESILIAETSHVVAQTILPHMGGRVSLDQIEELMNVQAAEAVPAPVPGLSATLRHLRGEGLSLGVMTNDAEASARAHLASEGIVDMFDFIAGYDSGHGAKPDPGPLLAFCTATGVGPAQSVMVGDSLHDLIAGRAAGMRTVGVLTGVAGQAELSPVADVVLPDIGHLAQWLGTASG